VPKPPIPLIDHFHLPLTTERRWESFRIAIIEIVTNRRANSHNEIPVIMQVAGALHFVDEGYLYVVAYRPLRRESTDEIDVWRSSGLYPG